VNQKTRFICFETASGNNGFGRRNGIFQEAYNLEDAEDVVPYQRNLLKELLGWFEKNLTTPDRFSATKSKGHYRRKTAGISWFKASSGEVIAKVRELIQILEDNGVVVKQIVSESPGYIVYEADIQIVAEPFVDR